MNAQPERADRELLNPEGPDGDFAPVISNPSLSQWRVEGIERDLTPLQYHYLSMMKRLIALKDSYQGDSEAEDWLMSAINKSIFSTLRDSLEANVGDEAKDLITPQQRVD
ncbi:hypothetical protein GBAR_LOCUS22465 [Geodia barretti]|uniref:Uncharacterized protein n=1 Tax=Geodia barretti TaxID=519541 RepID=A0AA35X6T5_GEOBA|nr:hypothetical protein GBAR_LOCUS22465 [Geodia barretti]